MATSHRQLGNHCRCCCTCPAAGAAAAPGGAGVAGVESGIVGVEEAEREEGVGENAACFGLLTSAGSVN